MNASNYLDIIFAHRNDDGLPCNANASHKVVKCNCSERKSENAQFKTMKAVSTQLADDSQTDRRTIIV